ncbi:hypothetical protein FOMPIDRAFT_1044348 [Fomitopsis schrenkii]|uniref:Uncharacterized protein n=1 Tax=Fomitopsis schrenkii TaxID=2126942 RepID=S8FXK8_FOMSC|nr:hypothetical protein FOMPIDRAFT_1044348 [Fomitopsis schrenkii]
MSNLAQSNIPYTMIFLRDGTTYFVVLVILLVLNATLSTISNGYDAYLSPMVYALQAVLLSHFILNLHEASGNSGPGGSLASERSTTSHISDLRFTRVIGSLAGSLAWGLEGSAGEELCEEEDYELEQLQRQEAQEPFAA